LTQRQAIRDRLFKKIGQSTLLDAVQTQTEVNDLVMPLNQIQRLFSPKRIVFSLPATISVVASIFVATFATGAMAQSARPGDPLYGVRNAFENVRVAMISDPSEKAALQLSIVNDRIRALETADGSKVQTILNESKKALASAQATISTITGEKAGDLNTKLKTLIESQKTALTTIAKDNVSNDEVKKTVLAMRDQLDKLITPTDTKPVVDTTPAVAVAPTSGFVTFTGSIGSYTAKPVLSVGEKRYYLVGATNINLISYMGSTRAVVSGTLSGDTISLTKLTIAGQLVWEQPTLDNNPVDSNLLGVEGDKTSLE